MNQNSPTVPHDWLPVKVWINYRILLISYMDLHDLVPSHISYLLVPYSTSWLPRSSNLGLLSIPRSNCRTKDGPAFAVLVPTLWIHLPIFRNNPCYVHRRVNLMGVSLLESTSYPQSLVILLTCFSYLDLYSYFIQSFQLLFFITPQ